MQTRLMRSQTDRVICGVCGGLAAYLGVESVWIRLAFVVLTFATGIGPGVLVYLLLCLILPAQGATTVGTTEDVIRANAEEMGERARELGNQVGARLQSGSSPAATWVAVGLILLGVWILGRNLGLFFLPMHILWPLILVALGVLLLTRQRRTP